MAFSHLINCLLLAYGPYFITYKAKNLSEYGAYKVALFAAASYLLTAACKVILIASLLRVPESTDFDFLVELHKNVFNFIEVLGLYFAVKSKYSFLDNSALRALAIAIGWGLADSVCSNLFFFILNASGDEFSWKYTIRAATSNIEILEVFCIVALILFISKNVRRTEVTASGINIVAFAFAFVKTVVFPTILSFLVHNGTVSDEDYKLPIAKGVLAVGLYISCKAIGAL